MNTFTYLILALCFYGIAIDVTTGSGEITKTVTQQVEHHPPSGAVWPTLVATPNGLVSYGVPLRSHTSRTEIRYNVSDPVFHYAASVAHHPVFAPYAYHPYALGYPYPVVSHSYYTTVG